MSATTKPVKEEQTTHNTIYILQINGMPWNFGQFESVALQAALYLLDELSQIAVTSRGNPALISRELSALVSDSSLPVPAS